MEVTEIKKMFTMPSLESFSGINLFSEEAPTEEVTITILVADEGKYLTESGDTQIMDRSIVKEVQLARADLVNNWKEISESEAQSILNNKEIALKAIKEEEIKAINGEL